MNPRHALTLAVVLALTACGDPGTDTPPGSTTTVLPTTTSTPEDLNCGDPGTHPNMDVPPGDPHGLDTDDDGTGCETITPG